ncbi:transforming acidic coiled-coil-containing protein 3 [Lepisosteus oculatus]|uniref:transforming acidic coiled-coil-containing protein 3 n=1 Tax=Lepisosteus oculatus TaxID=7918 RepID=UPI0035F51A39
MSVVAVNDENFGVDPARSCISLETCDILQPTGRPSILRQSQKENMPPKSLAKGVKVCFQTPLRDPVTRKIVSSNKGSQVERADGLDDCTKAMETLSLENHPAAITGASCLESKEVASFDEPMSDGNGFNMTDVHFPDDGIRIESKGEYSIDFDHLDAINPFKSSSQVGNSPVKAMNTVETPAQMAVSPERGVSEITSADDSMSTTLPISLSMDNSDAGLKTEVVNSPVVIKARDASSFDIPEDAKNESDDIVLKADDILDNLDRTAPLSSSLTLQNSPLPAKGSYAVDFDSLDSINPFKTGGSKLQNSPVCGLSQPSTTSALTTEVPQRLDLNQSAAEPLKCGLAEDLLELGLIPDSFSKEGAKPPLQETPGPEVSTTVPTTSLIKDDPPRSDADKPTANAPPQLKDGPVKLEFNFDDGQAKCKPPPKKLGKRPAGAKAVLKNAVAADGKRTQTKPLPEDTKPAEADIPIPKASYNFDFDTFDDPSFNPFGMGSKIGNSPERPSKLDSSCEVGMVQETASEAAVSQPTVPEEKPGEDEVGGSRGTLSLTEVKSTVIQDSSTNKTETFELCDNGGSAKEREPIAISENLAEECPRSLTESAQNATNTITSNSELACNEIFMSGTEFLSGGFDDPIDYLEQFGSSTFKESALRKQSLYMKFDPLLRESPQKSAPRYAEMSGVQLPLPLASRMEALKAGAESMQKTEDKHGGLSFLESFPTAEADLLAPTGPSALGSLVPDFPLPGAGEDAIFDVLKYSQKDMDAAIERVRLEVKDKECEIAEWQDKYEKLRIDYQEMGKIVSGFEATVAQIMDEGQKQKEAASLEIEKALQEKQQVLLDLNSMEKSFSDLFKRFEKQKVVIEGYRKNEETLKKCAQDYLARIKKEEQRYQTLKAHAEEKIGLANEEIAQVRLKLKAETAALQAQLRREQVKIQSLERSLEQKEKENEELTKLCDELIVNVQKT